MLPRIKTSLISLNVAVTLTAAVWLFYGSPLREELESRLSDLKTRIMPAKIDTSDVVIVTIDERTIKAIGGDAAKDLDYAGMKRLTEAVIAHNARAVVPLLHTQIFPYDGQGRADFMRLAFTHPNVFIGVFDLRKPLPFPDGGFERAYSAALELMQWEDVVNDVPMYQHQLHEGIDYLVPAVAAFVSPAASQDLQTEILTKGKVRPTLRLDTVLMRLNCFDFRRLTHFSGADVIAGGGDFDFSNKTVVIGYGVFRPNKFRVIEATFLNTPWQNPGDKPAEGVPVTDIFGTALVNVITDSWLRTAPVWVNVLQTITLAILAFVIWTTSISLAVLLYGAGFVAIMVLHSVIRRIGFVEIPIADSLFFATLLTFVGGFWRLRREIHGRAVQEAAESSEKELARTQERFLNRFSFELSEANQKIDGLIGSVKQFLPDDKPALLDVHGRAVDGSRELEDYLAGIRDLAAALDTHSQNVKLAMVNAEETVQKIVKRFDAKLQESAQTVSIECEGDVKIRTDAVLLEQIVHNLISNANKYSPRSSQIRVVVVGDRSELVIKVIDNGPGIAAEFSEKIFEKFYRIPNDQVYRVRGTGVGLFLSRYFATMIGATIVVDSAENKGSTFSLHLKRRGR